jgi:protein-S-isoprenylcysteine O-methyltransferase Ste14
MLPFPYNLVGIPVLVGGGAILVMASGRFRRLQTNINTFRDPDILVTDGLFAVSRNPMYLGFVLTLLGVAMLSSAASSLGVVAIFFLVTHFWYIPFEERAAEARFGEAYLAYKRKVRRWI